MGSMKNTRTIVIGNNIPQSEINKIQQLLPECKIEYAPLLPDIIPNSK